MKRALNVQYGNNDQKLALRICELTKLDPNTISADGFTIHHNHITYQEIQHDQHGNRRLDRNKFQFLTKQRTIRNPLPTSAWKETR